MKRIPIANQGEIRIDRLSELPDYEVVPFAGERLPAGTVISHSEQGNHHILAGDVDVMERVKTPEGMTVLRAIVEEPTRLFQDAQVPHEPVQLDPGIYEMRIKREYSSVLGRARRVSD